MKEDGSVDPGTFKSRPSFVVPLNSLRVIPTRGTVAECPADEYDAAVGTARESHHPSMVAPAALWRDRHRSHDRDTVAVKFRVFRVSPHRLPFLNRK